MTNPDPETKAIIICTDKRGVFFGYVPRETNSGDLLTAETVTLKRARMCVFWASDICGVLGLAASGPSQQCRVGPPATITVKAVHAVIEVDSAEAIERWEAQPWG